MEIEIEIELQCCYIHLSLMTRFIFLVSSVIIEAGAVNQPRMRLKLVFAGIIERAKIIEHLVKLLVADGNAARKMEMDISWDNLKSSSFFFLFCGLNSFT